MARATAHDAGRHAQMRVRIAQLAAQLIAEHAIRDYGLAKRKAARQLGAPDSHSLPSNEEVDLALADYHAIFSASTHAADMQRLREHALAVMEVLARFEPHLTGSVASGLASRNVDINLEIYADSSKDFEQFLLNAGIEFKAVERNGRSSYQLYSEPADIWVHMRPVSSEYAQSHSRDALPRHLTLVQLRQVLNAGSDQASASQRAASSA